MTWYEQHDGGYRARWRTPDGKKVPGPKFPTEGQAREWAIANGHDRPEDPPLGRVLDEWARLRRADRDVDPKYVLEVCDRLTAFFRLRKWVVLSHVTKDAVDHWRMEVEGVGVRRLLAYLLGVLRYMRQQRGLWMDPMLERYKLPRRRRHVAVKHLIPSDKLRTVIDASLAWGAHAHGVIHYLSVYGARPTTACQLRIRQVDFNARPHAILTVQAKTSGEWQHPLLPETADLMAQCARGRDPQDALFLCPFTGRSRHAKREATLPWTLTRYGAAEQLGRWYRTHLGLLLPHELDDIYHLKRYAITMMLRAGIDAQTVALFTGHLTVSQVLVYLRSDEIAQARALERIQAMGVPTAPMAALSSLAREIELPALPPPAPPVAPSRNRRKPLPGR